MVKIPLISQALQALVKILTKVKFKCRSKCCESDCICNNRESEGDNNIEQYIDNENKKFNHIANL